ncbi:MAG: tRNA threonylcarbamoyladenosine biosynthesis protein TsaE [Bacteroidetes bacterium ADurb.Bin408]|nr:MAG: tRNA threonylcarbamoyladenosine biosynthesis protein TsaE [Bacteroidetes bacterium ADurb.Bin408]
MKFRVDSVPGLDDVAAYLIKLIPEYNIFAFYGQMGAGKTTLIKRIGHLLGTTDLTTSPTFAIINEYNTASGEKIYHFDFYRIKDASEAYDIGYEEYFYSHYPCFIEWPEKIQELLPENHVRIDITVSDATRIIEINH